MSARIDITQPVFELCQRLGLTTDRVRRLDIGVMHTVAEVYKLRDDGAKYVDPDTEQPAIETVRFETTVTNR